MKKFTIQVIALLIVIFGSLFFSFNGNLIPKASTTPATTQQIKQIKINNEIINIELADSPRLRTKGLSGRSSLVSDSGMLFVFPEYKKYQFWMKEMRFPLDFIFIKDDTIVDILENVPNPSPTQKESDLPIYEPTVPINKMLEVNAGYAAAHNIKVGDKIVISE